MLIVATFWNRCFGGHRTDHCTVLRTPHCVHPLKGELVRKIRSLGTSAAAGNCPCDKSSIYGGSLFTCVFPSLWVWVQVAAVSRGFLLPVSVGATMSFLCTMCDDQSYCHDQDMKVWCCLVVTCEAHAQLLLCCGHWVTQVASSKILG